MIIDEIKNISGINDENEPVKLGINDKSEIYVYPKSINEYNESLFFIGKEEAEKYLFTISKNENLQKFEGEVLDKHDNGFEIKKCKLSHQNAESIQRLFKFTKPVVIGLKNSFGFGDRLGLANPAHIGSLKGSDFKPVIAQQSIRELSRTQRKPEEVMDAAVWAVFQEGYKDGFGADADHLKSTEDIDLMVKSGFKMFTFDPGDHVINEADVLGIDELREQLEKLNWQNIEDSFDSLLLRYENKKVDFGEGFILEPSKEEIYRAAVKYLGAIEHIKLLYRHLYRTYPDLEHEVEISVDETESVTTPFEHFFMASELNRLNIKFISLAPRFIGDFEKGIDYKGDIELFKEEYLKHVKITEHFGSYKISLHSGSDKFDVYRAIGQINRGYTHVKTAGTSYLEALKVVAKVEPEIFKKILDFSRHEFEKEKQTYHVSADLNKVKSASSYSDDQLLHLFRENDARQVLHVTFGKVLTSKNESGEFLFRDKIYEILKNNEDIHYKFLISHFKNHLDPFKKYE